jgi:hypothetical protein
MPHFSRLHGGAAARSDILFMPRNGFFDVWKSAGG